MSSFPIAKIGGIGAPCAAKLAAVGITMTCGLIDRAHDPKARQALAAESGVDEARILKWSTWPTCCASRASARNTPRC